ncbi:hypothetical protein ABIB17_003818 [Arthrobacter sp. UYEF6]
MREATAANVTELDDRGPCPEATGQQMDTRESHLRRDEKDAESGILECTKGPSSWFQVLVALCDIFKVEANEIPAQTGRARAATAAGRPPARSGSPVQSDAPAASASRTQPSNTINARSAVPTGCFRAGPMQAKTPVASAPASRLTSPVTTAAARPNDLPDLRLKRLIKILTGSTRPESICTVAAQPRWPVRGAAQTDR